MQFIPSTWNGWFADGNGDHRADPHNVYDASLAAARYLCAANRDLGTPEGLDAAIFSYNHSASYRNLVLAWMSTYGRQTIVVPDGSMIDLRGTNPVQAVVVDPATPPATDPAPPTSTDSTQTSTEPTTAPTSPTGVVEGVVSGVTGLVGGLLG